MSTDQAFFAAYGQPVVSDKARAKSATSHTSAVAQADRQRIVPSIETQYSDGSWYRLDQRHPDQNGIPAPHLERVAPKAPPLSADSRSWQTASPAPEVEWQSSCFVMAPPMPELMAPQLVPPRANKPAVVGEQGPDHDRRATHRPSPSPYPPSPPAMPVSELVAKPVLSADKADKSVNVESGASADRPPVESPRHWTAQWEVDEFAWPNEMIRLEHEQSEYFRYAGEKLRDASREGLKSMAVVATRAKEGCTTMAIFLARAAAAAGARVALLDANLDHPELEQKLGLDFSEGWQQSLRGQSTLSEAAVMALDSGLTLLPLSPDHRIASLTDPRISQVLRETAVAFDLVIIDAGVAPAGDVPLFESGAECPVAAALVVRDLRQTSEIETLATASKLKSLGIDAIGIAENFSPRSDRKHAAA